MDETHCACEAKIQRAAGYDQRVFRCTNCAAHYGIDVHTKFSVLGKQAKLFVYYFKTLLRHIIRLYVVDADLKLIESSTVQTLNALGRQSVAVGNQRRQHSV